LIDFLLPLMSSSSVYSWWRLPSGVISHIWNHLSCGPDTILSVRYAFKSSFSIFLLFYHATFLPRQCEGVHMCAVCTKYKRRMSWTCLKEQNDHIYSCPLGIGSVLSHMITCCLLSSWKCKKWQVIPICYRKRIRTSVFFSMRQLILFSFKTTWSHHCSFHLKRWIEQQ
jgi:hypothetical protein